MAVNVLVVTLLFVVVEVGGLILFWVVVVKLVVVVGGRGRSLSSTIWPSLSIKVFVVVSMVENKRFLGLHISTLRIFIF